MRSLPDAATLLNMYEQMVTSRAFEDAIKAHYLEGKRPIFNMAKGPIPGEMHLSSGQEPVAVGMCAHLQPADVVTAPHRAHHIAIAKGVDLDRMTAEIFGRATGLSGGRGGHMHLFDQAVSFSSSGIVAEGLPAAMGSALAFSMREDPHVAVAFIGEGAVNTGAFHETLNLASLWRLPLICVIEDNDWAISVGKTQSTAVPRNDVRAAAYGIPGIHVPENEPEAVYSAAGEAVGRARAGDGPTLIEVKTCRLEGHFVGDPELYRSEEERAGLATRDPLPAFRARLLARPDLEGRLLAAEGRASARIAAAFQFAQASAEPEPEQALMHVFA
jgi:pyruvate dehydrogenase E1 component alpha subunit